MKALVNTLILFSGLTGALAKSQVCKSDHSPCAYYCQTNSEMSCGPDNYLNRFGYRYCHAFLAKNYLFSEQGQSVLAQIRMCLIDSLQQRQDLTCDNAEVIASESHVACYLDNGFCDLNVWDQGNIFWVVRSEAFDPNFQQVMARIAFACGTSL